MRRTLLFCFEPIWFQKFRRCRIKNAKTYSSLGTFAGKRPNSTLLCRHDSRIGSPPIAGSFYLDRRCAGGAALIGANFVDLPPPPSHGGGREGAGSAADNS